MWFWTTSMHDYSFFFSTWNVPSLKRNVDSILFKPFLTLEILPTFATIKIRNANGLKKQMIGCIKEKEIKETIYCSKLSISFLPNVCFSVLIALQISKLEHRLTFLWGKSRRESISLPIFKVSKVVVLCNGFIFDIFSMMSLRSFIAPWCVQRNQSLG